MKIGAITDCFKCGPEEAFRLAGELGFDGVQIYAANGAFSPDCTVAERTGYQRLLKEYKLEVSALCGDMGGFGFERAVDNPVRIERTKRIVDLAAEFGARAVTTHIGVIPASESDPRYRVMLDAITECGKYAAGRGVTLAIETGPEPAAVLAGFVDRTEGGVGVNLDPANFQMVTGQDAVEAVRLLAGRIVHTHAKDGRMLEQRDPAEIYHAFALGGVEALNACDSFEELPLGEGSVDWPRYVQALSEVGFDGYLTVEREAGANPKEDIGAAAAFLKKLIQGR